MVEKLTQILYIIYGDLINLESIMDDSVENSQINEYIANLKGRKAYEEKKAIKLGFSKFEDYIANKISNKMSDPAKICKAPKQRLRRKNKTKSKPVSTCGCC